MNHGRTSSHAKLFRRASQKLAPYAAAIFAALIISFYAIPQAAAVPAFARKYQTSCQTCHTAFPALTPFGEAFRRNGFRFPSKQGSVDSDSQKSEMLALGQEAYTKVFPNAVWPDQIAAAIPLGVVINASTAVNLPNSSAHAAAGNTFAWNDFAGEFALFAAGAFNDSLTYFTELDVNGDGAGIHSAYLTWNDVVGPAHLVNISLGRLMPTLTSWGLHSSYLNDTLLPSGSIGGLYNASGPSESLATMFGHPDGIEVTGVAVHRLDYSLGWVASGSATGLQTPNSQDVYAHLGYKIGGMSLDGEAPADVNAVDALHPWGETALTVDIFGFRGLSRVDTLTGAAGPMRQDDTIRALGTAIRGQIGSFTLTTGGILERHSAPYAGTPATPATPATPTAPAVDAVDGTPDLGKATTLVQYNELNYVIYPWLIPALRAEYMRVPLDAANGRGSANLIRVLPGVAILFRPNIRLVVLGEIERAKGAPPSSPYSTGNWGAAGASIAAQAPGTSKTEAERLVANLSWGF